MQKELDYFNRDELAASVWRGKYALPDEEDPSDMHRRLAKEFARIEERYQEDEQEYFTNGRWNTLSHYGRHREDLDEESIFQLFKGFKYIIPQGSVMAILGSGKLGSNSNCFVIDKPHDSVGGILKADEELFQLMKRRAGVGINISSLRPAGTPVTNAASTSTGSVSFAERFSNTTRECSQNGRRGALMVCLDVKHPDVEQFATIKRDLTKVTGANISIFLRDDFMRAVQDDEDYVLQWPCEVPIEKVIVTKTIRARELWDTIIESAHLCAEPGLLFFDKHIDMSPDGVYPQYKIVAVNPCAEINLAPYDACRLMCCNLFSFVTNPFENNSELNLDDAYKVFYEQQRLADDLIDLEVEAIHRILNKIESDPEPENIKCRERDLWLKVLDAATSSRRTGCGFTSLGDMLAALNLKYDSDEAFEVVEKLMRTKMRAELDCTIDLAVLRGTFKGWNPHLEFNIQSHLETDNEGDKNVKIIKNGRNDFYQMLLDEFPEQSYRMMKVGRRNVSFSTVAPTGSVSILTRTTSGMEPLFMPYYTRRKKVNPGDKNVRVDFKDIMGDSWMEYFVFHPKFKDWYNLNPLKKEGGFGRVVKSQGIPVDYHYEVYPIEELSKQQLEEVFSKSPWYGCTANDIDWTRRVTMQSILQKYTSHSISSTINLPKGVSKEEVGIIYMESWKQGLKGCTVYVEESRSGVLVNNDSKISEEFKYKDAPKRPTELPCGIHHLKIKGEDFTVLVGLMNGVPYEVFAVPFKIMSDYTNGIIRKISKGKYNLICSLDEEVSILQNLADKMSDEQETITRLISTSLRHGANIKFCVEQLTKTEGVLTSFSKAIARVLKTYIPDGEKSTLKCENCGGSNVVFEEGCSKCLDCGSSKCG